MDEINEIDNFDEQLRVIKISRSPELYLEKLFTNLRSEYHKIFRNICFYYKENDCLIRYNSNPREREFCYHYRIYLKLYNHYHLNDMQIYHLMKKIADQKLGFKNVIPKEMNL